MKNKVIVAAILVTMAVMVSAAAPEEMTGKLVTHLHTSAISCDDVAGATSAEYEVDGKCTKQSNGGYLKNEYDGDKCKQSGYASEEDCKEDKNGTSVTYDAGCTAANANVVHVCGPKPFPVGAVVGAVVGVIVLGAAGFFIYKKKQG